MKLPYPLIFVEMRQKMTKESEHWKQNQDIFFPKKIQKVKKFPLTSWERPKSTPPPRISQNSYRMELILMLEKIVLWYIYFLL